MLSLNFNYSMSYWLSVADLLAIRLKKQNAFLVVISNGDRVIAY